MKKLRGLFKKFVIVLSTLFIASISGFSQNAFASTNLTFVGQTYTTNPSSAYDGNLSTYAVVGDGTHVGSIQFNIANSPSTLHITASKVSGNATYHFNVGGTWGSWTTLALTSTSTTYNLSLPAGTTSVEIDSYNSVTQFNLYEITADGTSISPPTLSATAVDSSGNSILSWSTVTGATNYNIYKSTDGGSTYTKAYPAQTTTSITVNVPSGSSYKYYGKSVDSNGNESVAGNVVTITNTPAIPAAPSISGTSGDGSVTINWSAVSGSTSYNLYQGSTLLKSGLTGTSYTVSGLTNGQSYSYQLTAVNSSGESPKSNTLSLTPTAVVPPSPTLNATDGDQKVTLSWNAVANASSYDFYQNDVKVASGLTSTTYTATGLTNGTSYNFYIKVIGPTGGTSASNIVSATPSAIVPDNPTLTATAGDQQVTLNWTTGANTSSVELYQDDKKIYAGTLTTYTATGLTDGQTYKFYVKAIGPTGGTSASNIVSATPQAVVVNPPKNVSTTGTTGGSGTITWDTDPNAPTGTTYSVYKNGQLLGTTTGNSYTDTNYSSTAIYTVTSSYNGKTSQPAGGGTLSGSNWGFTASDLFSNTSLIVASVAGFLLLGVAIFYARRFITFIRWSVLEKYKDHKYYQGMGYTYKDGDYWKDGRGIKETYYNNMKDTYGDSWERSKRKWWQRGWLS